MIRRLLPVLLLAAALPVIGFAGNPSAGAQAATVLISEIHYHPQSVGESFPDYDDREDTEFIELVNIGAGGVDVSNWCLRDAIAYCFGPSTTLAPNEPFVIARDTAEFEALYGFAPDAVYTARLSNSGELVRLVDANQALVTSVFYGSANPWPVTPDGNGPSLELVSSSGGNSSPAAWAASATVGGTPGAVPSLGGAAPPLVVSHLAPEPAVAGSPVTITATAVNATAVSLTYDVDFGANTTVAMTESAGRWTITVPALATGEMMRFRFEAVGPGGTTTSPRIDDSITWWATAVPTQPVSSVPVLDVHISDADWSQIEARTCGCDAVVVHDGRVWTGVEMRRAGLTSINAAKGHYRLDFPDGHPFRASWLDETSDELTLDMGWPNIGLIREQLSWNLMADLGFPLIQSNHVRVSRNGSFHGLYLLRDEQDGDWRARNGFDNGAFYKFDQFGGKQGWGGGWTKKEALDEPDTDLATFRSCLDLTGDSLRSCLLDQADVPQMIHEIAAMMVIRQIDQREFNWFLWRDDTQGGLWRLLPEDLDRTWGSKVANPTVDSSQVYRRCIGTDGPPANEVCRALLRVPEFEEMYNRRIRTLVDEHLVDPKWPTAVAATGALIEDDWDDDETRWNRTSASMSQIVSALQAWIGNYATHLRNGGHDGEVPAAQSPEPVVTITTFRPDAGDGFTYALIANPSTTEAVDISGWQFEGLATVADGAVLVPGATIAVTNDDAAFRSAEPDFTGVRARLDGPVGGATRLLRRDGTVAAELGVAPSNALILNEWNAVSGTSVLPGGDPTFGSPPGNGGDWFELVVVADELDVRGWTLTLADADGGPLQIRDRFVFADRAELAALERGLIITVSEDRADDLAYRPVDGDWHVNLQANAADDGAFFTPASQDNFDTNHHDWQLSIHDARGVLVFGAAGEGIGGLTGVNSAEVGELETDPSAGVDRLGDYGDGDASTYGLANVNALVAQDFSALRYPYLRGDVNCDATFNIVDALFIAQATVGSRTDTGRCPLAVVASNYNDRTGDLNRDGVTDIVDALVIARCTVGIDPNGVCPDP